MRTAVAVLLWLLGSAAAFAALEPRYYQEARANAPDVIVLQVVHVGQPPFWRPRLLTCQVNGRVAAVERGSRYSVGQSVTVPVPCAGEKDEIPAGGTIYQDRPRLAASRWGRAFLDADGSLALSQYDILAAYP